MLKKPFKLQGFLFGRAMFTSEDFFGTRHLFSYPALLRRTLVLLVLVRAILTFSLDRAEAFDGKFLPDVFT